MDNYCMTCKAITDHILHRVSADLFTWMCGPCTTWGPTEAKRRHAERRKHAITDPEAFDQMMAKARSKNVKVDF